MHQAGGAVDCDWVDADELIVSDARDYDGVIVQRNAASPRVLTSLTRRCKDDAVPLVFDPDATR
jgi:hypothetical protein